MDRNEDNALERIRRALEVPVAMADSPCCPYPYFFSRAVVLSEYADSLMNLWLTPSQPAIEERFAAAASPPKGEE